MVFVVSADVLKKFQDAIFLINVEFAPTASDRSILTAKAEKLPQGILTSVGFSFNLASGTTLRKGDTYIFCFLNKRVSGNSVQVPIINDYIINMTPPKWVGEVPIEDGDELTFKMATSNANLNQVVMTGYLVRIK